MGFLFSSNETSAKKTGPKVSLDTLHKLSCKVCPLNLVKGLCSPKMAPSGSQEPLVYVLGEAPGSEEDERGEQFVGASGKMIKPLLVKALDQLTGENHTVPAPGANPSRKQFQEINDYLKQYVRFNNTLNCHPNGNRNPEFEETEACRPRVEEDIENTKPLIIIGVGSFSLKWMVNEDKISGWRGKLIPVKVGSHTCWFMPVLHPSYLLRLRKKDERSGKVRISDEEVLLAKDLMRAFQFLSEEKTPVVENAKDVYSGVRILKNCDKADLEYIERKLEEYGRLDYVSFDYEANKLKPYAKDAKLLSISVGTDTDCIAFGVDHKQARWKPEHRARLIEAWRKFLFQTPVKKIAHNLAFELEWTMGLYGKEAARASDWEDTMAQAYILDTSKGMLSLNVLAKQHLGFDLKSTSDIHIEKLDDDPLEDVLYYNTLDVKYTYKLFVIQRGCLDAENLEGVYREQVRRVPTVTLATFSGIIVDQNETRKHKNTLTEKIQAASAELRTLKVVKEYEERYGEFNPASPKQVGIILQDYMKRPEGFRGEGKAYATDETILEKINHPFAEKVLEYRGLNKLLGTYVVNFEYPNGTYIYPDGNLHPQFSTCFTSTRRLCIAEGSKILIAGDSSKELEGRNIEDVKEGDLAYCFDDAMQPTLKKVLWAGKTGHKQVLRIHWKNKKCGAQREGYLDLTPEHPVRLTTGEYVQAKELKVNSHIASIHRGLKGDRAYLYASGIGQKMIHNHIMTKIEYLQDKVNVYDLEIEDHHNFIANELCVHNSSSAPNGQNFPKRDYAFVRSQIVPPPGHVMFSFDYGQIEARVIAMASRDESFCKALWENYDVHMEWAERLAHAYPDRIGGKENIKDKATMKLFRSDVKNQFVFPLFFNAWYKSVAGYLRIPEEVVKPVVDEFWKTFSGVKEYQQKLLKQYDEDHEFYSLTGFKFRAPIKRTEIVNYPVQSTAACLTMDGMNRLSEKASETGKWYLQPRLQIHDDLTGYAPEECLDEALETIITEMLDLRYDFINVPIVVEGSIGPNWFEMESLGDFRSNEWFEGRK